MNPDVFALAALILVFFVVLAPPGHHFEAKCSPRPTQVAQVYYFGVFLCDFGRPFCLLWTFVFEQVYVCGPPMVRDIFKCPPARAFGRPFGPKGAEREGFGVAKWS